LDFQPTIFLSRVVGFLQFSIFLLLLALQFLKFTLQLRDGRLIDRLCCGRFMNRINDGITFSLMPLLDVLPFQFLHLQHQLKFFLHFIDLLSDHRSWSLKCQSQ
jgi:hypothetical protein